MQEQFTAAGGRVIIAGRRDEQLAALKSEHGFDGDTVDVTDAGSVTDFRDRVIARFPGIDTVFISSGIMVAERVLEPGALEVIERTVATNLLGTIRVVDAFLPHLLGRPAASIITVTSGLAYVPMPLTPTRRDRACRCCATPRGPALRPEHARRRSATNHASHRRSAP